MLLFLAVTTVWRTSLMWAWVYAVVSMVTFGVYAFDKSAARRGARRTSERSLHLLALAGGWPGALLAQQMLRHKSRKVPFRRVFWGTVILNIAGLVLLRAALGSTV